MTVINWMQGDDGAEISRIAGRLAIACCGHNEPSPPALWAEEFTRLVEPEFDPDRVSSVLLALSSLAAALAYTVAMQTLSPDTTEEGRYSAARAALAEVCGLTDPSG